MSILVDNSNYPSKKLKSGHPLSIMIGVVVLSSALFSAGFTQLFAEKSYNISMIVVNNGKLPPTKEIAKKIKNEPIPLPGGDGGGDSGGDSGSGFDDNPSTTPLPKAVPDPTPAAPKDKGVIDPKDMRKGKLRPPGNESI